MVSRVSCPGVAFSKMHGAGNDFVILDLRDREAPSPDLCRRLADRHTGVGCDLILGVEAPRSAAAAVSYRIWTAEGLPSWQCGNGARCIAAWALRAGLTRGPRFLLDSPLRTHEVEQLPEGSFRIAMGVPRFEPSEVPMAGFEAEQDLYDVVAEGRRLRFAAVSVGNPHAVVLVDDVRDAPVADIGRLLQRSPQFPNSVNVGFAEVASRDMIRLRVYEFGAGETLACGTGACAAAVTLMRQGRVDPRVSVALPGGRLEVAWESPSASVMMAGPAAFAFEGVLAPDAISA